MTSVTRDQVLRWRLRRHHLADESATDPVDAARRVSGVHAQVAASAVAAVDLRVARPVNAQTIDRLLYEDRRLVRTWAARGTLHLLPADDLPTWVAAMSTRAGWTATVRRTAARSYLAPNHVPHRLDRCGHPFRAFNEDHGVAASGHRTTAPG